MRETVGFFGFRFRFYPTGSASGVLAFFSGDGRPALFLGGDGSFKHRRLKSGFFSSFGLYVFFALSFSPFIILTDGKKKILGPSFLKWLQSVYYLVLITLRPCLHANCYVSDNIILLHFLGSESYTLSLLIIDTIK